MPSSTGPAVLAGVLCYVGPEEIACKGLVGFGKPCVTVTKGLVYPVWQLVFDMLVAVRGVRHTEVYLVINGVLEDAVVERVPIAILLLKYFGKNRVLGISILEREGPKRKFAKEVAVEVHMRTKGLFVLLECFMTLLIKVLPDHILLHPLVQYMWVP